MKLLLHTCCAPCIIYPLERLKANNFEVTGYFYNPNIYPLSELNSRKQAVMDFSSFEKIKMICPENSGSDFFYTYNESEAKPERCFFCWSLRLRETALYAKKNDYACFSTTLLVSPYQNQEMLKDIGTAVAKDTGVNFYYEDFRPGFRKAHNQAREKGIYRQKYCGCIYSQLDRCRQSGKR